WPSLLSAELQWTDHHARSFAWRRDNPMRTLVPGCNYRILLSIKATWLAQREQTLRPSALEHRPDVLEHRARPPTTALRVARPDLRTADLAPAVRLSSMCRDEPRRRGVVAEPATQRRIRGTERLEQTKRRAAALPVGKHDDARHA